MNDTENLTGTLAQMALAAEDAAALVPPLSGPTPFDSWAGLKTALDAAEGPVKALLRDRLDHARPGLTWADELDTDVSTAGEAWVVDPLDGAVQYLQGLPQWAISIALVRDGRPILAALHSATLGHTYTAALGAGAFLNGAPISPSPKTNLALSMVGTSHPPLVGRQPDAIAATSRAMSALLPVVGAHRNLGPTSWQVADVASGRMDAFWQYGRDAGNLLGASLVARESGASVTDAEGRPWHADSASFLAAPAGLHAQLVRLLANPN